MTIQENQALSDADPSCDQEARDAKTAKMTRRERKRLERLKAMAINDPLGMAAKAMEYAITAAVKREQEMEAGHKLTRKERRKMWQEMSAGVQAAAHIGQRVAAGADVPQEMLQTAMTQRETLIKELTAAVSHNAGAAMATAERVGSDAVQAVENAIQTRQEGAGAAIVAPVMVGQVCIEKSAAASLPARADADSAIAVVGKRALSGKAQYSEETGEDICQWIQSGKSLNKWCLSRGCDAANVYRWMREVPSFSQSYARAHEDRTDTLVEDMLDIADELQSATDVVQVMAGKLRIETRRWIAERMRPTKYGQKVQVEQKGQVTFNLGMQRRQASDDAIDVTPSMQSLCNDEKK